VTIDETTNQKKKRKATWGKFTSGAWGSRRFGGWSKEGLVRFNQLYSQVEQDRKKDNAAEVEETYRLKCVNSKKAKKERGQLMTTTLISRLTTYKRYCDDKFKY